MVAMYFFGEKCFLVITSAVADAYKISSFDPLHLNRSCFKNYSILLLLFICHCILIIVFTIVFTHN